MMNTYEAEVRRRVKTSPSFVRFLAVMSQRRVRNMTEAAGAIKALMPGLKTVADLKVGTEHGKAWERLILSFNSWKAERPMA
ncbi:MAG: hypothetical protein ACRDC7_21910 [Aeromonas veronii]